MGQIWSITCFYNNVLLAHTCVPSLIPCLWLLWWPKGIAEWLWEEPRGLQSRNYLLCDALQKACWARASQPFSGPRVSLALAMSLIAEGRGPEVGGRNRNPESPQLWGDVLGQSLTSTGVRKSVFLKKPPASFPKRSEAGSKGTDRSSMDRRKLLALFIAGALVLDKGTNTWAVFVNQELCVLYLKMDGERTHCPWTLRSGFWFVLSFRQINCSRGTMH